MADLPYRDPALPVPARVDDLVSRMTLPEKVGQMLQLNAKDGVTHLIEDLHVGSVLHASPKRIVQAMDLAEGTRLGIPLLIGEDCIHGHSFWPGATIYPTQLGMAASWDPELVERVGRASAVEISATGVHWTFSPVLCIARDLRWGRVGETFGEDPYLLGEFGSAMVRGYQGDGLDDPTAVLACAKHFAGYSETQGGRDASEADLSRRKLRSWFLPPFERVAREGCRTFMIGYQSIDGVPITMNQWLLREVLRDEWNYTGTLVTDWDNVGRMVWEQHVCADHTEAAARAVRAGNDLIMTTPQFFDGAQDAVARGQLTEAEIDAAVRRILTLKFELGLFENPRRPDPARQAVSIGSPDHTALNLEMARRSLVLLSNDGTLPLLDEATADASGRAAAPAGAAPRRIAVIGPNADAVDAQLGDWAGSSGQADWLPVGHPRHLTETVLDGLRAVVPADWSVAHARGCHIAEFVPDPQGPLLPDGQPAPDIVVPARPDAVLLREAVATAEEADLVVAVVGDTIGLIGETRSTATLDLVGGQVELLDSLAATGKPMVVVVISSKPQVLPPSAVDAAALIQAFNPGMRGGRAIAELLLGLIEPSGRLPLTVPRHVGQQPVYYNQIRGQHGDRYADLTQDPLFAFGEGRAYTEIAYTDLRIHTPQVAPEGDVRATVTLANTGRRPARETVQVYIRDLVTSVTWADKELKAHRQVDLRPGQTVDVDIVLPAADCTLVTADGRRVVEPGSFDLLVGSSSRDRDLLAGRFRIDQD
ncbi:glycoside hydrolase family 3 N-terminal domain-containing protein [Streptomyces sp. NPDC001508]|uniref:exo-beta-d-1,3/1,6-glucosidase n=1 Tax=Streptomyces sp. NPDC001508 TaxID=3154656 RepID=UPI0033333DA5